MRRLACMYAAILLLLLQSYQSFAQERTISGRIISEDNIPLVGVTVENTSTKKKVLTNQAGEFKIQAQKGQKLTFTYVGFEKQTVTVGDAAVLNINLKSASSELEEVTVAMDIKRNPKELGYSAQKVAGADIQTAQRTENFLNALQGRVAGLTINQTSGVAGASSGIVLRGFNSLSLSNQPLFVVDGIVMDNQTIDENSDGGKGVGMVERTGLTNTSNRNTDYTNRIADINPNDIESITILKGPEATALYGSQAGSGAIIITTKKAKSTKLAVQYDNSFRIQKVTRFPDTFDGYSTGSNGIPINTFKYFGPAYDMSNTTLYNNKDAFFRTGFSQAHNIGADFGLKNSMFRFSGSFFDQDGVVPNNSYRRYNLRLSNTTRIGKMIDITPSVTYIRSENKKVLRSAGGFMLGLLIWPNTVDLSQYKNDNGGKIPVFAANAGSPNAEYDNPLFNVNFNKNYDATDRYQTSLGININPYSWLTLSGRFGYEFYSTDGYLRYHPLSYYISSAQGGLQDNFYRRYSGYNHTITATAKKKINKDFSGRIMVGTMWQDYQTKMYAISGTGIVDAIVNGQMIKNGVPVTDNDLPSAADSNATKPSTRQRLLRNTYGEYNLAILRQLAYFGEVSISFRNYAFLTYTHRFESASTLPAQNRKYNYPGASLSLIMSDMFPGLKGNLISYWKLRTSLASTARLNTPYSTQSVFVNALASGGGFSYGFTNANPDLRPEQQKTYEIGTELRMFGNKIGLDFAYYNTLNEDQIIENFRLSYATGYVLNTQNAGSTRNQGVELSIDATVMKKKNFDWNMRFNFNRMWNKVVQLPPNVAEYYIADTWLYGNARGGLNLNGPTTTITSYGYQRNNKGDILISPTTGLPMTDGVFKVRGDRNPDFTLGFSNEMRYKNWKLSMLWDLKVGGDVFNGTNMFMTSIGRSYTTADRMLPRVIQGVLKDGKENTADPTINTIAVVPQYIDAYYQASAMPEEAFIEKNVNWLRLRDITLSYTFPKYMFARKIKSMKSLSVFATGNDLFLFTNYTGADPGVNGNTAGTRGVGAFGFDYGTLPAPISVNFGLKATF